MTDPIPPLRVGITGHRFITDLDTLIDSLEKVFQFLDGKFPFSRFEVYSGLAEGADRLAAKVFLGHHSSLIAVIPLPVEEYQKDFTVDTSLKSLELLLQKAEKIIFLSKVPYREQAYAALGEFLLQNSNILITLWDGQPSSSGGSTGNISTRAIDQKCPVIWIHTINHNPQTINLSGLQQEQGQIDYLNFL